MARPAQFKREVVLQKAMETFWNQGFYATSMADLVSATNLKPGSLYAAFESKEDLFNAALDYYGQLSVSKVETFLAESDSPLQGIRAYFRQLADEAANPKSKHSCFLVNTVLELSHHNKAVQKRVNGYLKAIEALFRGALKNAQTNGELSSDKDPDTLAAFLMSNIWGMRVLSGTTPTQAQARSVVKQILQVLE
jgi:TetR/AcrR family transcriptional regulator, transcriptional repressor for nem operon